jgi:hypothetical protein
MIPSCDIEILRDICEGSNRDLRAGGRDLTAGNLASFTRVLTLLDGDVDSGNRAVEG